MLYANTWPSPVCHVKQQQILGYSRRRKLTSSDVGILVNDLDPCIIWVVKLDCLFWISRRDETSFGYRYRYLSWLLGQ